MFRFLVCAPDRLMGTSGGPYSGGRMDARGRHALRGANLQLDGQNRRLRMGLIGLMVALGLAVWLVSAEVHRGWRLLLFFPFFSAAIGAWQGLYRTCPNLAAKGIREDPCGRTKRVISQQERMASRHLGRCVLTGSFLTAALATLLVVALP